jgi:hypothetical protein
MPGILIFFFFGIMAFGSEKYAKITKAFLLQKKAFVL